MQNNREKELEHARVNSKNYPDLVNNLKKIGITGYVFEVASQVMIYRYNDDSIFIKNPLEKRTLTINPDFNEEKIKVALENNQQGRTDFPTFLKESAEAGIKLYDADFKEMVVSYYATNNLYVESIPRQD